MEPLPPPTSPHTRRRSSRLALRARVWIQARHFFSRSDAQANCWLWLLDHDGRVHALRLPQDMHGHDDVLPELQRLSGGDAIIVMPDGNQAVPLPNAPIVPLTRWAVSWGHPVQADIRAFAAELDRDVLAALGALETAGAFFGTVDNYNRLVSVDGRRRRHRLQALSLFPPLVAPVLLEAPERPDMFGNDRNGRPGTAIGNDHDRRRRVLDAIDRGRDLIGELARHHGIDRALVRSALCRRPWPDGGIPQRELQLLHALPAHARPLQPGDLESRRMLLDALPLRLHGPCDLRHLARTFNRGWNVVWDALQRDYPSLHNALRDCRDFAIAALDQTTVSPAMMTSLPPERLTLAWIAQRGLRSLLEASRRWHAQPLLPRPEAVPDDATSVPALFGECRLPEGHARELLSEQTLFDEGERMRHCVADYWDEVLFDGIRLVHLETPEGDCGTAQYQIQAQPTGTSFVLEQLRGPCNAEPGTVITRLAEAIQILLSAPELETQRQRILRDRERAQADRRPGTNRQTLRPLDARSRRELHQVLTWCGSQPDFTGAGTAPLHLDIAGFHHSDGPRLLHRLHVGDELTLVREPDNPYDPRAVRVDWRQRKLGYLPRAHNATVARLLDSGHPMQARIATLHASPSWTAPTLAITPARAGETR